MSLEVGAEAPLFSAESESGEAVRLESFRGDRRVVLFFYPKDDTPGCTAEAKEFRDALAAFEERGAAVIGCSGGGAESHAKFKAKYDLNFPLLVDEDAAVASSYGAYVEKQMFGKRFMGVSRKTFLIDESGKIAQIWEKVKPKGHAAQVLAALDALSL